MPNEPPFLGRIHIEQLEIFAHIGVPDKDAGSVYRRADVGLSSARHLRGAP
jgi:hypothetical protein